MVIIVFLVHHSQAGTIFFFLYSGQRNRITHSFSRPVTVLVCYTHGKQFFVITKRDSWSILCTSTRTTITCRYINKEEEASRERFYLFFFFRLFNSTDEFFDQKSLAYLYRTRQYYISLYVSCVTPPKEKG